MSNGADDATVTSLEVHGLPHDAFLEEVHSFEFWFQSVQGYLAGTNYGHRPGVAEVEATLRSQQGVHGRPDRFSAGHVEGEHLE